MALTVHRAGSILVGNMVSEHDTTVKNSRMTATFQKARFARDRRLKGPHLADSIHFCWLPTRRLASASGALVGTKGPERFWPKARFILFLQKPNFGDGGAGTYGGALQRTCSWYAIQSSSPHGYYLDDRLPWSPALEREVRAAVARQDIDALIRRAERIVLGRILPVSAKRAILGSAYSEAPRTISVTRTLKGTHRARLDVQPIVPFWNHPGGVASEGKREFLWLLWRGPGGAFEPVELLAGIVEVRNGRVPAWGVSFDTARLRIEGNGQGVYK